MVPECRRLPQFEKELKRLRKKYRTLDADIAIMISALQAMPEGDGTKHWNRLHVSSDGAVSVYKVRLACTSLGGESRFRVIYGYNRSNQSLVVIDLIEIYFKGDKENEDEERFRSYVREVLSGTGVSRR